MGRDFLPRERIVEGYILPHIYKRKLDCDTESVVVLEEAYRIIQGYDTPTDDRRDFVVKKLHEAAKRMDELGAYMTHLVMVSAAHYINPAIPPPKPELSEKDSFLLEPEQKRPPETDSPS